MKPPQAFPRGKRANKRQKKAYKKYDDGDDNYATLPQSPPRDDTNPLDF